MPYNYSIKHLLTMKIETANIKETLSYKLVSEEARELSWKLQNTIYVIYTGNGLVTSMKKLEGVILCAYKLGNDINH